MRQYLISMEREGTNNDKNKFLNYVGSLTNPTMNTTSPEIRGGSWSSGFLRGPCPGKLPRRPAEQVEGQVAGQVEELTGGGAGLRGKLRG
jgi:hypothetical protein